MARCRSNVFRPIDWSIATIPVRRFQADLPRAYTGRPAHDSAEKPTISRWQHKSANPQDVITSAQRLERRAACIAGLSPEFLLDPQKLIVFCGAVGARQRTSLYLSAIGRDREVRDGGVLGLA